MHYGTFRELVRDAQVKGADGEPVTVPAGTSVQIPHYSLHHSEEHWGETVHQWDPDRDFQNSELWGESKQFAAWNPSFVSKNGGQSQRFFPFQYAPRQCLGMNYAQIVMRVLLASMLRTFDITLAPRTATRPVDEMSIARPLLKPKSGVWLQLTPRFPNQHHPNPLTPRPAAAPPRQQPAVVADGWAEMVARAREAGERVPLAYPWGGLQAAEGRGKL